MNTSNNIGYDFDGVLCEKPHSGITKSKNKLSLFYQNATQNIWFKPQQSNIAIITARLNNNIYCTNSRNWLDRHCFQSYNIFFYTKDYGQKSLKTIATFKAKMLKEQFITHYYDDNLELLKLIKKQAKNVAYFWVDNDTQTVIQL